LRKCGRCQPSRTRADARGVRRAAGFLSFSNDSENQATAAGLLCADGTTGTRESNLGLSADLAWVAALGEEGGAAPWLGFAFRSSWTGPPLPETG
jgi:hypothetical protein